MPRPTFSWFPYRILALAVPVLALVGAGVSQLVQTRQNWMEAINVFFLLLGAGNGFLLGSARGELGRLVLAVSAGAGMGLSVCTLLSLPGVSFLVGASLLAAVLVAFEQKLVDGFMGGLAVMLMCMVCLWSLPMSFSPDAAMLTIPFGIPLVCCASALAIAKPFNFESLFEAGITGLAASVHGCILALPVWDRTVTLPSLEVWLSLLSAALMIANYGFVYMMFEVLRRGEERGLVFDEVS